MQMPEGTRRALEEALEAIQNHLRPLSRPNFILIGAFALHFHGMERATEDLNFAVNSQSLNQLQTSVASDSRFVYEPGGDLRYYCTGEGIEDVGVTIEFIDVPQLTHMEGVTGISMESGIRVATLEELAMLKAEALVNRSKAQDGEDLLLILQKMEAEEYQFEMDVQDIFTEARGSVAGIRMTAHKEAELTRLLTQFAS
jgi:Nucleotidyl transferase AbiEii toxin, Type IV TA system